MAKIEISLDIPDVEIENIEMNKEGDVIITVRSTVKGTHCHKCVRKITKLHGHDREITLRHLSILGRKVYIRIRPARYLCTHCKGNPTTTQELTWYEPRSPHTIAYEKHILRELVHSTVLDVSIKEDLGYEVYEGYINAAREVFGKGIPIVLDRFHIAKLYRKGLDELRKREMKRLKKELPKEEYEKLKGAKGNIAQGYKRIDRRGSRSLEMVI